MQTREKLLAGGLVLTFLLAVGLPKLTEWWNNPIDQARAELTSASDMASEASDELAEVLARQRRVAEFAAFALPADSERAALLYQQWLTEVASEAGKFENLRVIPEQIVTARDGGHDQIPVRISGQSRHADVVRFVALLESVPLLHRVASINVTSPTPDGDPLLDVTILVEAASIPNAPERGDTLFPQQPLLGTLSATETDAAALDLSAVAIPPDSPFRIGDEVLRLVDRSDDAPRLERGVWGTPPGAHTAGAMIEVYPSATPPDSASATEVASLLSANLFTPPRKPTVRKPALVVSGDTTAEKGGSIKLTIRVDDAGDAEWTMRATSELPPDAEFKSTSASTAELRWTPPAESPPQRHEVRLTATAEGESDLETEATLTLNSKPAIELTPRTVSPGDTFEVFLSPTDADLPADELTLTLADLPSGATWDAEELRFRWTPASDAEPQEYRVSVTVTDRLGAKTEAVWPISVGDDPLRDVVLTFIGRGFGSESDSPVAWLRDRKQGTTTAIRAGTELEYPGFRATVEAVEREALLLKSDAGQSRLTLGDSLRDAIVTSQPQSESADAEPTDTPEQEASDDLPSEENSAPDGSAENSSAREGS